MVRPQRAGEDAAGGDPAPGGGGGEGGEEPRGARAPDKADDAEAVGSTPQDYAAFVKKEQARWKDVIQRANIKID